MSRLRTSWTIFSHAFAVVRQHKALVIFPLFGMVTTFAMFAFYLVPMLFHVTNAQTWHALWNPIETLRDLPAALHRYSEAISAHSTGMTFSNLVLGLAVFYLANLFATTFLNVAFYRQIIQAMNGGRASVLRGFAVAVDRLPAIAAWTLLTGTVGLILRWLQGRVSFTGQWIVGLLGAGLLDQKASNVFLTASLSAVLRAKAREDYYPAPVILRFSDAESKRRSLRPV